ncbi:hypothetical protein [Bacillus cereus]|uniref:hypothetical protein n=1 Tax=Bacillus cereus TaxID=1396 RepID=UPI002AC1F2B1|nr:hypothetical protein [Bacillus cereus]MDZ4464634.1 hypothetical protein [Bacillus cereus]
MDKHYVDERVNALSSKIYGLERVVANLEKTVSMLSTEINTKANTADVQRIIEQSKLIKQINDSKPVEMDCKVGISLDGMVSLESIDEHTADSIKCRVIKGSEMNETK